MKTFPGRKSQRSIWASGKSSIRRRVSMTHSVETSEIVHVFFWRRRMWLGAGCRFGMLWSISVFVFFVHGSTHIWKTVVIQNRCTRRDGTVIRSNLLLRFRIIISTTNSCVIMVKWFFVKIINRRIVRWFITAILFGRRRWAAQIDAFVPFRCGTSWSFSWVHAEVEMVDIRCKGSVLDIGIYLYLFDPRI